jgi:hypothetical protein
MVKNWRTDLQGALVMFGAVTAFGLYWLTHGVPDAAQWALLWAGVNTGVGLIRSADGAVVAAQAVAVAAVSPPK